MRGFTLIELLAVLGLMALLIGGGIAIFGLSRDGILRGEARIQLTVMATQIETYKTKTGYYPGDLTNIQASTIDPWGSSYVYQLSADSHSFTLTSPGPDQQLNTSDDVIYDSTKN